MADKCDKVILAALGREATDRELAAIKRKAGELKKKIEMANDDPLAVQSVLGEFADTVTENALVSKRLTALNYMRTEQLKEKFLSDPYKIENPDEFLKGLTVDSLKDMKEGKLGVLNMISKARNSATGAYWNNLDELGVSAYARDPASFRPIGMAIWDLQHGEAVAVVSKRYGKMAVESAETMINHRNSMIKDINLEGGNISLAPDHILQRSYDVRKMAKAGGHKYGSAESFKAWKSDMAPMNWEKSFDGQYATADQVARDKILRNVYDGYLSGKHVSFSEGGPSFGKGSIARKYAYKREIVFDEGAKEVNLLEKYGWSDNIGEAVDKRIQMMARDVHIMRRFGSTPLRNWDKMVNDLHAHLINEGKPEAAAKLIKESARQKKYIWPSIVEEAAAVGDNPLARALAFARGGTFIGAKIGASVVSNVGDAGARAVSMIHYRNRSSSGFKELMNSLGRPFKYSKKFGRNVIPNSERKRILAQIGIRFQSVSRPWGVTPEAEMGIGGLAKFGQQTMKYALHSAWSNSFHTGNAISDGIFYWSRRAKTFTQLEEGTQVALRQFGLDDARWNIIRQMAPEEYGDGIMVFQPGSIREMPLEKFKSLVDSPTPSENQLLRVRDELADNYRNLLGELAARSTSDENLALKAIMSRGTRPATVEGELIRMTFMLKSFIGNYMRNSLGREIHGYMPENEGTIRALTRTLGTKAGGSGRKGLSLLMTYGIMLGYARNAMVDLVSGKTPADPFDPETAGPAFRRAFAFQALGLYGDFFLAESIRGSDRPIDFTGRLIDLLGPGVSNLLRLGGIAFEVGEQVLTGEMDSKAARKDARKLFSLIYKNVPGNNLIWTKYATDYWLYNNFIDMLDPGYIDRLEDKTEDRGQTYLFGAGPD